MIGTQKEVGGEGGFKDVMGGKVKYSKEKKGYDERVKVGNNNANTHPPSTEYGQENPLPNSNKGQERGRKKARQLKDKARSSDGMSLYHSLGPKTISTTILSGF